MFHASRELQFARTHNEVILRAEQEIARTDELKMVKRFAAAAHPRELKFAARYGRTH